MGGCAGKNGEHTENEWQAQASTIARLKSENVKLKQESEDLKTELQTRGRKNQHAPAATGVCKCPLYQSVTSRTLTLLMFVRDRCW